MESNKETKASEENEICADRCMPLFKPIIPVSPLLKSGPWTSCIRITCVINKNELRPLH